MHTSQEYCWKSPKGPHHVVTAKPTPSVIQQRGNVIVARSQLGDNNNGQPHYHQLTPVQISDEDEREERDGFLDYKIPVGHHSNTDGGVYYTAISYEHDNQYHQRRYRLVDDNPCSSEPHVQTVSTDKSEEKTDQNGDDDNNNRQKKAGRKKIAQCFTCQYCEKTFRHKSYYDYHMRTHTGDRPFQCSLCDKSFFERSKLNRHLSSCHNIKTSGYTVGDDDNVQEKLNSCSKCHKTFSRSEGLQAHIQTHHEGSRPFACTKCDKKFSGLTALKNHEKSHQGVKSILCDLCGKAFLLKKYLDLHLNTTHKREAKKHGCAICRKEFHSDKDLRRHQLMHSRAKNFTCSLCQTSFKRKDNLNRHLKLTHLLTPEQISEESGNSETSETNTSPSESVPSAVIREESAPAAAAPPINQVSVIKSTHEVMMSITRGHPYI